MVSVKINVLTYMHFTVFDTDGVTPLTGQVGACTESLRKDGAASGEAVSLTEIGATGRYYASFTPLAVAQYDLEVTCPDGRVVGMTYETNTSGLDDIADTVWDEAMGGHVAAGTFGLALDILRAVAQNRYKIDTATKIMTVYDEDKVTPLLQWNMKDAVGAASTNHMYERSPV